MVDFEGRITSVFGGLEKHEADALLVTSLVNVRYLTGFSGTNGQVLVTRSGATFFTDPRYEARAVDIVHGADIVVYPAALTDVLDEHLNGSGVARLGVEATTMTIAQRDEYEEKLAPVELVPMRNVVEDLRRTKDADEIDALRRAVAVGDEAFEWTAGRLVPGMTERAVALDIEVKMRGLGAEGVSFPAIVGTGPLSAHIHHSASDRELEKGDLILMDFGCVLDGYCSDLTRTVVLGGATEEQRSMYSLVLVAQQAGIEAVRSGAATKDVDGVARKIIDEAGHAARFGHGLGHGVGLDIHEAPRLHRTSLETLREGDVVTVEPGVYVPGWGGIRIEDCVLVTDEGAEVLGGAPKDRLIEL